MEPTLSSRSAPPWLEVVQPLVTSLFVVTDPGRDQDDEDVLVGLNRYVRMGLLSTLGVVANLAPSAKRARLAKGTLGQLGLAEIPVGIGTGCNQPDDDGLDYQFNVTYLAEEDSVVDGYELLRQTLIAARPQQVVLLLISGLTDAARMLRDEPALFLSKVRRVVFMGGVETVGDQVKIGQDGLFRPDATAQNVKFDGEAANYLYRQLQLGEVPMTILTRHASGAAKVPRAIYDRMAETGHPVGIRVRDAQKLAIEEVWRRANLPEGDPKRMGLPARCNKDWFCGAFLGGQGKELTGEDSIWNLVQTFMLYDPMTLIAAVPVLREYFYQSCVVEVGGVEHHIIGVSPARHGVNDPNMLSEYLVESLVASLEVNMQSRASDAAVA